MLSPSRWRYSAKETTLRGCDPVPGPSGEVDGTDEGSPDAAFAGVEAAVAAHEGAGCDGGAEDGLVKTADEGAGEGMGKPVATSDGLAHAATAGAGEGVVYADE